MSRPGGLGTVSASTSGAVSGPEPARRWGLCRRRRPERSAGSRRSVGGFPPAEKKSRDTNTTPRIIAHRTGQVAGRQRLDLLTWRVHRLLPLGSREPNFPRHGERCHNPARHGAKKKRRACLACRVQPGVRGPDGRKQGRYGAPQWDRSSLTMWPTVLPTSTPNIRFGAGIAQDPHGCPTAFKAARQIANGVACSPFASTHVSGL